jgi:hypothetical protein
MDILDIGYDGSITKLNTDALYPSRSELRGITCKKEILEIALNHPKSQVLGYHEALLW